MGTQNPSSRGNEENRWLDPPRDKNVGKQHRRRKGEKSCVTYPCVTPAGASTIKTCRINGVSIHTHTTMHMIPQ